MLNLLSPQLVFWVSIIIEIFTLISLRTIGIDWNYHVDSVTYIEKSSTVAQNIYSSGNYAAFLNNGFYLLVDFLSSKPIYVISFNIFLFSLTNLLIIKIMRPFSHKFYSAYEYLIIFNPYRVYLGTTVLKDTLVCFLLILSFYFFNIKRFKSSLNDLRSRSTILNKNIMNFIASKIIFLLSTLVLFIVALRSFFYLPIFIRFFDNPKRVRSWIGVILLVAFITIYGGLNLYKAFENASLVNMDFREYGQIPNFASFGLLGTILRTFIWPFLYATGTFVLFSPSLELILISAGILFVFILQIKIKVFPFLLSSFFSFFFFAGISSGFLSFGRYALPAWLISSIVIYIKKNPKYISKKLS